MTMARRRRQIVFLLGAGSMLLSIQTAFQTATLAYNTGDPELPNTAQQRTNVLPGNANQLNSWNESSFKIWSSSKSNITSKRINDTSVLSSRTRKKEGSESVTPGARSIHGKPHKVSNFEKRTRAAEFNVDRSRLHQAVDPDIVLYSDQCLVKATEPSFVLVGSTKHEVPFWQRKLKQCGKLGHVSENGVRGYFLAEMLQVRIYQNDLASWSINELKQWIHFMFLAGVDHIFLCDNHRSESERLDIHLEKYINLGLISYFNWNRSGDAVGSQIDCYEHVIGRNAFKTMWTMAVDMDEYPVSFSDTQEGFLMRYLAKSMELFGPDLTEISIPNFLMLGEGDKTKDLVSSRINRMTLEEYGKFVKPIFRPKRVVAGLHNNQILFGSHAEADSDKLRTLHYWGKRLQEWGPDTEKVLNMTRQTRFMLTHWDDRIRNSLIAFGEDEAFSAITGP